MLKSKSVIFNIKFTINSIIHPMNHLFFRQYILKISSIIIIISIILFFCGCIKNYQASDDHVKMGVDLMKSGKLDDALSEFNLALDLNSKNAEAIFQRGILYFSKAEWEKSKKDFDEAIEKKPLAKYYDGRGYYYITKNE